VRRAMATDQLREAFGALAMGDTQLAVKLFTEVLAMRPDHPEALLGLARTQLARRAPEEARAPLERLVALEPGHHEAQSHLAMLEALAGDKGALDRLRSLSDRKGAGFYEHFNLGLVLAAEGDLQDAEVALDKAITAEPASVHALVESGQLAMRRRDFALAVRRFQAATVLDSRRSLPYALLSRAHYAKGERGKALATLAEAIRRAPTERPLFEELYRLCLEAGAPRQAAGAATELLRLSPKNPQYLAMQGEALLACGQLEEARRSFLTAHEIDPDGFAPTLGLGRVARASKDPEQAKVWLERAHAVASADPRVAWELAELLLELGREEQAEKVLTGAYALRPDEPRTNLLLARALRKADRSRAIAHARKAAKSPEPDLKDQAEQLIREI